MATADSDWVGRAIAGDEAALARLLKEVGPQVRQKLSIRRKWRGAIDVDDVMQVTYLEAFLRVRKLDASSVAQFAAWLARIAENNLRDAVQQLERQKRTTPGHLLQPAESDGSCVTFLESLGWRSTTPSRTAAVDEARDALCTALQRLPDAYREVLQRYDLEGRSSSDVALAMNRTPGAVYMLRARALDRLREILGPRSRYLSGSP